MRTKFTMSDAALITLAVAAISVLVFIYSDDIVRFIYAAGMKL
jgi:small neutral amino acid transporter SnatA (MarC family)